MTGAGLSLAFEGRTPGRALYVSAAGTLYVARGYGIHRSDDGGRSWEPDCQVPDGGWKALATRARPVQRLLRHEVYALRVLSDGTRVAVARDGVYRAGPGERVMARVFQVRRGSRPIHLTVDGRERVLFGEYGGGLEDSEVYVYVSEDGGRRFEVGHAFPRGDIRHVHNIVYDPGADRLWVLVGDYGRQPGIGVLAQDLGRVDWLARGTQSVRAVVVFVEGNELVYGTDSELEANHIVRMDARTGRVTELLPVEGSTLFAARFGDVRLISTCVEPSAVNPSRQVHLYGSVDGFTWRRVAVFGKDRWPARLFQFGTLVLPVSDARDARGILSGQALRGIDGMAAVFRVNVS